MRRWIVTGLSLALVSLLAWYIYRHWSDMRVLLTLSPASVGLLLGLSLALCFLNALYRKVIVGHFGARLSVVDWWGVTCVSNVMAYVLPMRADLLFSAAYYKKNNAVAYTKSISMAAGNIVFGVTVALVQILAALLCIGWIDGQWPRLLWGLLALGLAAVAVFCLFSVTVGRRQPAFLRKHPLVQEVVDGFNALLTSGRLIVRLTGLQLLTNFVQLLMYLVAYRAIGMPVTLYQALFYASVSWLCSVVAVVPGNIGIRESIMGVATLMMGSVFQNGVAAALLMRAAEMVVYLLLAAGFGYPVYRNLRREAQPSAPQSSDLPQGEKP